jgi:hypothetical protein
MGVGILANLRHGLWTLLAMTIIYRLEPELTPEDFIDVLRRSTLAERRPVQDLDTIRAMLWG